MDFSASGPAYLKFLKGIPWKTLPKTGQQPRVGIFYGPWHFSQVPWFDVNLAILYRQRGWDPVLIWDDLPFGDIEHFKTQNDVLTQVAAEVKRHFEIVKLSEVKPSTVVDLNDAAQVERLGYLNAIWRLQTSEPSPNLSHLAQECGRKLADSLSRIRTAFELFSCDHWVVPHGLYGNTGLFLWEGQRRKVRVSTYDCDAGSFMIGLHSPAGHQEDVREVANTDACSIFSNQTLRAKAIEFADREIQLRTAGKDKLRSQSVGYESVPESPKFDILMPLNIDYDSAALGKHCFFEDANSWVLETVEFILENTSCSVAVRQHPGERFDKHKRDLATGILKRFGNSGRFRFFSPEEKVNTYALVESSMLVLPATSTVGLEAAILGKQVVCEANPYYAGTSFAEQATSKEDYFARILRAVHSPVNLSLQQRELAKLYYFLTLIGRAETHFTPQPADFEKWAKWSYRELLLEPSITDILDSFEKGIPLCVSQTKRALLTPPNLPSQSLKKAGRGIIVRIKSLLLGGF